MHCPMLMNDGAEVLLAFCAGKLEPQKASELELHVEMCASCRATVEAQKAVWSALDEWEAAPVSAGFDRRLYARIEQEEQSGWHRMFRPERLWFRPALALTAATVVIGAGLLLQPVPDWESTRPTARIEAVEVEQVEQALEDLEMLKQLSGPVNGEVSRQL